MWRGAFAGICASACSAIRLHVRARGSRSGNLELICAGQFEGRLEQPNCNADVPKQAVACCLATLQASERRWDDVAARSLDETGEKIGASYRSRLGSVGDGGYCSCEAAKAIDNAQDRVEDSACWVGPLPEGKRSLYGDSSSQAPTSDSAGLDQGPDDTIAQRRPNLRDRYRRSRAAKKIVKTTRRSGGRCEEIVDRV